jgi:tetratricopeptide (TPR) repeat protein
VKQIFLPLKKLLEKLFSRKQKKPPKKAPPKRSTEELLRLLEKYTEAVRVNPQDGMGHYNLGEVYIELSRLSEALGSLKEAIRINPKHRSAYYQLGFALIEMGRDEDAIEPLETSLQLDPKSQATQKRLAQAHTNISVMLGKRKQFKESMHHIQEAIRVVPDYGPAHLSMGICFTDLGRYEEALKKFKEALQLDKNLAVDANFNFGIVYSKLGSPEKAIKHYQEAVKVNPKSALPNLNLGMIYSKQKNYSAAVGPLRTALKASPKIAREANFKLGVALMKLKRYTEAVPPLQEALQITPNNEKVRDFLAEGLYQASRSLGQTDNPEEEIETLKEAVAINPEHMMAHFALAKAYDKDNQGYYAITHTLIAKHFFVEAHKDECIGKALQTVNQFLKKYKYTQKDFSKVRIPRK